MRELCIIRRITMQKKVKVIRLQYFELGEHIKISTKTTLSFPHITCRKCLDESSKKILSSSVEGSTYKPTVPRWTQWQQFPLQHFLGMLQRQLIFPFWMQVNPPLPPKSVNWHRESRLTPRYYWIHSQNIWHWDCVLVTVEYKGTRVMNKLSLMWRGLLSKWKPILIHTFVSSHSLDVF